MVRMKKILNLNVEQLCFFHFNEPFLVAKGQNAFYYGLSDLQGTYQLHN